jgi:hypothetical protein
MCVRLKKSPFLATYTHKTVKQGPAKENKFNAVLCISLNQLSGQRNHSLRNAPFIKKTSGHTTPLFLALFVFSHNIKNLALTSINHWENNQRHSLYKITKTTMTKKNNEGSVRNIAKVQLIPGSSAGHDDGVTGKDRCLSFVSHQYYIDGNGQLDEAEFASESVKPVLSRARH